MKCPISVLLSLIIVTGCSNSEGLEISSPDGNMDSSTRLNLILQKLLPSLICPKFLAMQRGKM